MALRPTWTGHLRLALVSCPIKVIPATTTRERVRFHKINRETGNRLRQVMVDSETGEPVSTEETIMGYEFEKNRYVTVEKDELADLKIENSDTLEIERVVEASAVDCLYWDTPYLLEPDGKTGLDIFATLREALREKGMAGLGRIVLARRERPVLLVPRGQGLMMVTLRDPDEVRRPETIFDDIPDVKIDQKNLSMAETLIERMQGDFDLSMFEDRYQEQIEDLVKAKIKGEKPIVAEEPQRAANVVNLFDALKASLENGGARAAKKPAPSKHARKAESRGAKRTKLKGRRRGSG